MDAELSNRSIEMIVAESGILILINAVSFTGNFLVAFTIYRSPRLRKISDMYIFALAFTDLMWATCVMPLTAITLMTGKWNFNDAVCEFQASVDYFVLYISPVTMGLTAFNRYMRVVKPKHYRVLFSSQRSRLVLGFSWLILLIYITVARCTKWQTFEFMPNYALCTAMYSSEENALIHYCITISLFFLFPFAIFVFSYYNVYRAIRRHSHRVGPIFHNNNNNNNNNTRLTIQEVRIRKALFVVITVFIVCWLPSWAIALLKRLQPTLTLHRSLKLIPVYLPFLSSAINPFVYAGNNPTFRSEFKRLFSLSKEYQINSIQLTRGRVNPRPSRVET